MKTAVIYYSMTGNNEKLAARVAALLSADLIKVTEKKRRTTGTIVKDILFGTTPKTAPSPDTLTAYELCIFVGPVWMGKAATPLRAYFKALKAGPRSYAYISLSGGGLNPNPGLGGDLKKQTGSSPAALIDLHISDLLPSSPKPTMKDTIAYLLDEATADMLAEQAARVLRCQAGGAAL